MTNRRRFNPISNMSGPLVRSTWHHILTLLALTVKTMSTTHPPRRVSLTRPLPRGRRRPTTSPVVLRPLNILSPLLPPAPTRSVARRPILGCPTSVPEAPWSPSPFPDELPLLLIGTRRAGPLLTSIRSPLLLSGLARGGLGVVDLHLG